MKKQNHTPARTGELSNQYHNQEAQNYILICIFCEDNHTQQRAIHLLHRDMGSQLLHIMQERNAVCAQLRTLDTFSPSECLSFYHYHLQRSLGTKAQVWLSTKGGAV
jgi:hypothetical protein